MRGSEDILTYYLKIATLMVATHTLLSSNRSCDIVRTTVTKAAGMFSKVKSQL